MPAASRHHAGRGGGHRGRGLLLLASNDSPAAQLVAVLFMENAIALFESLLPEPWPLPVHVALSRSTCSPWVWAAG
jgi:hydrogenase-4 membrane subunit HyfE